jgi:hypothetical protein
MVLDLMNPPLGKKQILSKRNTWIVMSSQIVLMVTFFQLIVSPTVPKHPQLMEESLKMLMITKRVNIKSSPPRIDTAARVLRPRITKKPQISSIHGRMIATR